MNGLVPDAVEHAVRSRSVSGASQSFGAVAVVLLLLLLVEWEAVRMTRSTSAHWIMLTAVATPLALVVLMTIAARIVPLL